jgi:hypothetical protein
MIAVQPIDTGAGYTGSKNQGMGFFLSAAILIKN